MQCLSQKMEGLNGERNGGLKKKSGFKRPVFAEEVKITFEISVLRLVDLDSELCGLEK
jgi:hypothetical protein